MSDTTTVDPLLVAQIVRRYVSHNAVPSDELPNVIATVHRSLAQLGKPADLPAPTAAVAVNRSYGKNFVICLDCGWRGQMLRRHLSVGHGLSPDDYRARWHLKASHPLTAPGYSARRSTLAKQLGLGRSPQPASEPEPAAPPPVAVPAPHTAAPGSAFVGSPPEPRRRGRPRRAAP
jgi:predicted transcriptional regulator